MHLLFTDLDCLTHPKRSLWTTTADQRLHVHREWKAAELRVMHIAVVIFTILSGTLALTLCACGVILPFTTGHLGIAMVRSTIGIALGIFTYDLNNLREIVYKANFIFEEYLELHKSIPADVIKRWRISIEQMKKDYRRISVATHILEFIWPLTTPPQVA